MNSKLLLSSLICSLCFSMAAHANTKTSTDQQTQKYQQVCKHKKQGDAVSFAYKGVIFNGVCENDDSGKLSFQPPTPNSATPPDTQSRLSETQSAPRPVNPNVEAPSAPATNMDQTSP